MWPGSKCKEETGANCVVTGHFHCFHSNQCSIHSTYCPVRKAFSCTFALYVSDSVRVRPLIFRLCVHLLTLLAAMCPVARYYIILICITPDDFTCQGESAATQWVKWQFQLQCKHYCWSVGVLLMMNKMVWH